MDINETASSHVERLLTENGYTLVQLITVGKVRKTIQLMIERVDDQPISFDDCGFVTKLVIPYFDEHSPTPYQLEVSSPGTDRPLTKPQDFERFQGQQILVQTHSPLPVVPVAAFAVIPTNPPLQKKIKGILANTTPTGITLELLSPVKKSHSKNAPFDKVNEMVDIAYTDIRSARLSPF